MTENQLNLFRKVNAVYRKLECLSEEEQEKVMSKMEKGVQEIGVIDNASIAARLGISLGDFVKLPAYKEVKEDTIKEILLEMSEKLAIDPLTPEDVRTIIQAGIEGVL